VDQINLTSQVTGALAAGSVTGLGALALLNTVNLNSQVTGALNGLTQVTNLGNLAYVNGLAANQIGAGTLAAGVVYAGTVNAANVNGGSFAGKSFTGGTFTGSVFRTAASGARVEINDSANSLRVVNSLGQATVQFADNILGWSVFSTVSTKPAIYLTNSNSVGLVLTSVNGSHPPMRINPL